MKPDKIVLRGPGKLTLTLDADQIYPDDPGMGTPMLFQWGKGETMTWACGYEGGNLGEIVPKELVDECFAWAEEIADEVAEWEDEEWRKACAQNEENK